MTPARAAVTLLGKALSSMQRMMSSLGRTLAAPQRCSGWVIPTE